MQKQSRDCKICSAPIFAFKIRDTKNKRKNAGDYLKLVKASRPLGDDSRKTSDGRADRCAVFGEDTL